MADETEKKFIFTADGRKLLVSQVGGIKFAVLGVALVYTEKTLVPEEPEADFNLTLDDLSLENNVVLGLKKIYYTTVSIPDNDDYGSIAPEDTNKYINALNDLEKYLIPVHYKPTLEKQDQFGNAYGTYDFDVDKTTLSWDMFNNIAFKYIVLFGKQYAETSDATFNVDKTQKPTVIGIVKYPEDSVIMFNKEASDYCAEKVQLTFTITDIDEKCELDITSEDVLEASKKLSLINNGLYTRDARDPEVGVSMSIAGTQTIIEDLDLDASGALAMTKTLMVAETTNGTELVEQLNPGSMVHIVNNEIKDESTEKIDYKPQLVFTTIEGNQDLTQEITAYNTIFSLRGKGNDLFTNDAIITASESPRFELNSIPSDDYYAVNIFGNGNEIWEEPNGSVRNIDAMLFSNSNSSMNPASVYNSYNRNLLLFANANTIQDESYGNLLLGTNSFRLIDGSYDNFVLGRKPMGRAASTLSNAYYNAVINVIDTVISGDASHSVYNNTVIGGSTNNVINSDNILMLSLVGLSAVNTSYQVLMGKWNKPIENAAFIFGYGDYGNDRRNLMELYPNGELKLFNSNGTNTVTLGGDAGVQLSNLAVTSFSADNGYFNKKSYVGDPGGNGYPHRGLYVNYTPTTNNTYLNISQGYAGANLSYNTNNHSLIIEDAHPYTVNVDRAEIRNEYASFRHFLATEAVHGYSDSNNILINGNIVSTDDVVDELGTLTVHNFYKDSDNPGIGTKVNVKSDKIEFNTYDDISNSWVLVKEIRPNENNRISMDVYVFGIGVTSWSTTVVSIRGGTKQQQQSLYNLFTNCPPFGYSLVGQNLSVPNVSYRLNGGVAAVGSLSTLINDFNYMNLLASNNSNLLKKNPFNNTTSTHTSDDEYYQISVLPNYIDELEINLFIRGYAQNHFNMFWIPGVFSDEIYRNYEPMIKMNIIIPRELQTRDVIYYRNFDYYGPDDYELSRFTKAAPNECEVLQLRCRPYKVDKTPGYSIKYENEDYACCWNKF